MTSHLAELLWTLNDAMYTKIEKRITQVVYKYLLFSSLLFIWFLEFINNFNPRLYQRHRDSKQIVCVTSVLWANNKLKLSWMKIKEDGKGLTWEDLFLLGQAIHTPWLRDASTHLSYEDIIPKTETTFPAITPCPSNFLFPPHLLPSCVCVQSIKI